MRQGLLVVTVSRLAGGSKWYRKRLEQGRKFMESSTGAKA